METRSLWRNSKETQPNWFVILFKFIWLVPMTPAVLLFLMSPRRSYGGDDYSSLSEQIIENPTWFLYIAGSMGIILWLMTVRALCRPVFQLQKNGLRYSGFGFLMSDISFGSIVSIKPYRIFPFGTLVDMKSKLGTNVRFFALVATINKPALKELLSSTTIKVE